MVKIACPGAKSAIFNCHVTVEVVKVVVGCVTVIGFNYRNADSVPVVRSSSGSLPSQPTKYRGTLVA